MFHAACDAGLASQKNVAIHKLSHTNWCSHDVLPPGVHQVHHISSLVPAGPTCAVCAAYIYPCTCSYVLLACNTLTTSGSIVLHTCETKCSNIKPHTRTHTPTHTYMHARMHARTHTFTIHVCLQVGWNQRPNQLEGLSGVACKPGSKL